MYFGFKHVETGPSCSHKLATFLKYHMPLNKIYTIILYLKRDNLLTLFLICDENFANDISLGRIIL